SELKRIFFKDENEGIALIDSVAGYGVLYKTTDKGKNWERASGNHYFVDMYPYYHDSTITKVVLAGPDNGLARYLMEEGMPGVLVNVDLFAISGFYGLTDFTSVWAYQQQNGNTFMIAGRSTGRLYFTKDAGASQVSWVGKSADLSGSPVDIAAEAFSTSSIQV